MPGGGNRAPFEPGEHDVVSTKLRSWNLGHQGNLNYAELLVEYALKLPPTSDRSYSSILSETAKDLVELITIERGGRFLKLGEGENHPHYCVVMDYKACHHKVLHGLKNKQKVILTKGIPPKPTKLMKLPEKDEPFKGPPRNPPPRRPPSTKSKLNSKPKPKSKSNKAEEAPRMKGPSRKRKKKVIGDDDGREEKKKKANAKPKTSPTPTPPRKRRRKRVTRYEAKQREDGGIDPYALELISYVCNNQRDPILEQPGLQYPTPDSEPDRHREIRLQLRHRIFAALAVKMTVVEFATKLMEVWGGSLAVTSQLVQRPGTLPTEVSPDVGRGAGGAAAPRNNKKNQFAGKQLKRNPSDDESDSADPSTAPRKKKIPQKEPRRMQFANSAAAAAAVQNGWSNDTGNAGQEENDNSSSDDEKSSSSSSSSDEEESDSDSSSAEQQQQQAPTYSSPYGFGYYDSRLMPPQQEQPASGGQSENESSEEVSSGSEDEGNDYERHAQQQPGGSGDLNILTAAANYELESMKVDDDYM